LDDDAWPIGLKDYHVGQVVDVGPPQTRRALTRSPSGPRPIWMQLRDVMVMTKQ